MPCLGLTPIDYHSIGLKTAWPTPNVAHRLTVAVAVAAAAAASPETLLQLQNPRLHPDLPTISKFVLLQDPQLTCVHINSLRNAGLKHGLEWDQTWLLF